MLVNAIQRATPSTIFIIGCLDQRTQCVTNLHHWVVIVDCVVLRCHVGLDIILSFVIRWLKVDSTALFRTMHGTESMSRTPMILTIVINLEFGFSILGNYILQCILTITIVVIYTFITSTLTLSCRQRIDLGW
jgi:hypothetical protein